MKRVVDGGFTIVETLIVLAVSGVLFISLVGAVQGQQGKAQFKNSMTDIVSDMQSIIGQVSTGYYPANGASFTCEAVLGVTGLVPQVRPSFDPGKPGANDDCTFMGQAIMFGVCNIGDVEKYTVQTLVGLRRTSSNETPANYSEAQIRVMAPGASIDTALLPDDTQIKLGNGTEKKFISSVNPTFFSATVSHNLLRNFNNLNKFASVAPSPEDNGCGGLNPVGGTPNYGETKPMAYGTTIKWMAYDDAIDDSIPIAGLAVVTSPGTQINTAGASTSGSVRSNIIPIPCGVVPNCTSRGADQAHGVDAITRAFEDTNGLNVKIKGMKLCFTSASTEQSALVRVGPNNAENSIEMTIYNNLDCM